MSVEKKTIRSDIPGHHTMLNGTINYAGSTQEEGRRLVVGRDITLNGDISACEHLVVEGTVNAQGFDARRLDVLEAGCFAGSAQVQDAVVAGRIEGKLTVSGRLTVKSTGRLYGEIEYGAIECESGARIEGHLSVIAPAAAEQPVLAAPLVNDNVETIFDASTEELSEDRPKVFRRAIGF